MAANPCDCQQCRIRRELFGGAATTPEQREEAVYSLAFVLGGLLAWFDDAWLSRILQQVVDTRAERSRRTNAEAASNRSRPQQDGGRRPWLRTPRSSGAATR